MYVICGLGNPGQEYEGTRHNIGFTAMDLISKKYGIDIRKEKFDSIIGTGRIGKEKVILVKPQTYINLSGKAVYQVMDYFDVDIEHLIVIYDDFDIPLGNIRIRKAGSAGTHNGMRSIVSSLKTGNFPRIRVGIGDDKGDLIKFVLGKLGGTEKEKINATLDKVADAVETIISDNIEIAMSRFNSKKNEKKTDNEQ